MDFNTVSATLYRVVSLLLSNLGSNWYIQSLKISRWATIQNPTFFFTIWNIFIITIVKQSLSILNSQMSDASEL